MNIRTYILERLEKLCLPPLVPWVIFFCSGIIFESYSRSVFYIIFSLALFCVSMGIILLRKRGWSHFFLFTCAFFIGAMTFANSQTPAPDSIVRAAEFAKQAVQVKGIVISEPYVSGKKISFMLEAFELKKGAFAYKISGKVFVQCYQKLDLNYGDALILEGSLHRPFGFLRKKGAAVSSVPRSGAAVVLSVKKYGFVERIGRGGGNGLKHLSLDLKRRMKNTIASSVGKFSAVILEGILLGEQGEAMRPVRDMMVKTGTWHIMVVSGSHTALLAFIFLLFFKAIRIPRTLRFLLTMALLVVYCFLTGSSSPVVRATVMTIVLLSSYLIERNPIFYNGLALAAILILVFDPLQLFNIGFQLSFLSVFFIVWLFPKINGIFRHRGINRAWQVVISYFSVSLCAWIGTAPLLAGVFGSFSPITVPANMVIVPLAMLVVTSGFVLAALGSFSLCLARPIAQAVEFFIFLLLKINSLFCGLPFASYEFPSIPLWLVFGLYILLFFIFNPYKSIFRKLP
ncbi:MAG: ComEC/Rec2 family competence protein [Candidatus Omnitrophota bacterium]